jgi:hypothetical protein
MMFRDVTLAVLVFGLAARRAHGGPCSCAEVLAGSSSAECQEVVSAEDLQSQLQRPVSSPDNYCLSTSLDGCAFALHGCCGTSPISLPQRLCWPMAYLARCKF